ncbi:MAG: co-chaperone YbbN [Pseudomonadota bacterium]
MPAAPPNAPSATETSPHVSLGSDQTFMADVIETSQHTPVIVDFWAPWCGPCRSLIPVLDKHVNAQNGKVKLVKINIDENPGVAGQLGVRSIPAVFAFDNGRPVDGFMGGKPDGEVRAFIEKIVRGAAGAPPIDEVLEKAADALRAGDVPGAAQIYAALLEEVPENVQALAGLARCYLADGDPDRARAVLEMVPEDQRSDPEVKSVLTALELTAQAPDDSAFADLIKALDADPENHAVRHDLAQNLAGAGRNREAMDHLLHILGRDLDWNENAAKDTLLRIFEALGPKDPITVEGRRRLGSLMFS